MSICPRIKRLPNKLSITNDINKNLLESNASNNNYIESNINLCNISACKIKEINDGTIPFDENDNKGNDSSDKNGIVRSFDTINYTINYTTDIKDSYVQDIDSANLMIDFTHERLQGSANKLFSKQYRLIIDNFCFRIYN